MKQHSRPLDLDKLITRVNPKFGQDDPYEEDTARIQKWLALADRMLNDRHRLFITADSTRFKAVSDSTA